MIKKKKRPESTIDVLTETLTEALSDSATTQEAPSKEEKKIKYVVVRDNKRVSDIEYDDPKDPAAISERDFWMRVVARHPDGTMVSITKYNNKIHRVYGEIK